MRQSRTLGSVGGGARQRPLLPGLDPDFVVAIMPRTLTRDSRIRSRMKADGVWFQVPDEIAGKTKNNTFDLMMSFAMNIAAFDSFLRACIRNHRDFPRKAQDVTRREAKRVLEQHGVSAKEITSDYNAFVRLLLDQSEVLWAGRLIIARAFFVQDKTLRQEAAGLFNDYPSLETYFGGRPAWVNEPERKEGPLLGEAVFPIFEVDEEEDEPTGDRMEEAAGSTNAEILLEPDPEHKAVREIESPEAVRELTSTDRPGEAQLSQLVSDFCLTEEEEKKLNLLPEIQREVDRQREYIKALQEEKANLLESRCAALKQSVHELRDQALGVVRMIEKGATEEIFSSWMSTVLAAITKADPIAFEIIQNRMSDAFAAIEFEQGALNTTKDGARKLVVDLDADALRQAADDIDRAKTTTSERLNSILDHCLPDSDISEMALPPSTSGDELQTAANRSSMQVVPQPASEQSHRTGLPDQRLLEPNRRELRENIVPEKPRSGPLASAGPETGQTDTPDVTLKLEPSIHGPVEETPNPDSGSLFVASSPLDREHLPFQAPVFSSTPMAVQIDFQESERRTADILAEYLNRNDVGAAFQLQRARQENFSQQADQPDIDARLLWVHALVASEEWHQAESELSRTMDEAATDFPLDPTDNADIRKAQALLAGLACIASALSTGSITAATLYQQAGDLATKGVPEINSILHSLSNNQGSVLSLNSSSLQVLSAGHSAGTKAEEIARLFSDVIRNRRKHGDRPTDKIIGRWVNGGMLDQLGQSMKRGNSTDVFEVENFLQQFYTTSIGGVGLNEDAVYQRILDERDRLAKGGKFKIETWTIRITNRFLGRLCNLASQWARAKRLEVETGRQATNDVKKLIRIISTELLKLRSQLEQLVDGPPSIVTGAATVALETTAHLIDLIVPNESSQPKKRPFKHVIGETVVARLGVHIDSNVIAMDSAVPVIETFLAHKVIPPVDSAKVNDNLERGSFLSAELVFHVLVASGHDIEEKEYTRKVKRALSVKRRELTQALKKLRDEADIAAGKGILSDHGEAQLERFRHVAGSIDPSKLPEPFSDEITYPVQESILPDDLGAAIRYVEKERGLIAAEKRRRGKSIERHLTKLVERDQILPTVATQVRNALTRDNYSAAQEFLNTPDTPLVQAQLSDAPYLPEYTSILQDIITFVGTKVAMEAGARDTAEFISTTPGGGLADDVTNDQAAEIIGSWRRLGVSKERATETSVKRILGFLGFTVEKVGLTTKMRSSQIGPRWIVQTQPINDRSVIPVYRFGSEAAGRYVICVANVGCSWQDLCKEIGAATNETIIVLYKGVLRESVKVSIREAISRHSPSLVVFDQGMLLYSMTKPRSDRLRALFHLALPYTLVNPYRAVEEVALNEMFVGRQAQMRAIIDPDDANFLYGGRQLGKTALLMQAEATHHNPAKGMYVVTVLLDRGLGVPEHLWERIGEALTKHGIVRHATSSEVIRKRVRGFLEADETRQLTLLIDEADAFLEQDIRPPGKDRKPFTELDQVKRLMSRTNNRFKVVFCGLNNVMRHDEAVRDNSPLLHMQQGVLIGPFEGLGERLEAIRFVQQPLNAIGYNFEDPDLPYQIIGEMNFYPSLIMLFCNELVKHLNEKAPICFPAVITGVDIEAVQARQNFRQAQEKRFFGTLALDDRYELLCRIIVEHIFDQKNGSRLDAWMNVSDIAAAAELRWAEAFPNVLEPDVVVEALLDEMVQLGVLRRPGGKGRRYTLRSINLLMLFKDKIANEAELDKFEKRSPPQPAVEPAQYRIPGDPADKRRSVYRSPLTYANFKKILQADNIRKPVVVFGSALSDIQEVPHWMHLYRRQIDVTVIDDATSEAELRKEIADLTPPAKSEDKLTGVVFVAPTVPWTLSWCEHKRRMLEEHQVRLVMLGELGDAQVILREIRGQENDDTTIDIIEATPWSRGFVRQWISENGIDCLHEEGALKKLEQETVFLPGLMNRIANLQAENPSQLRSLIDDGRYADLISPEMEEELRALSFEHRAILWALANYGTPTGTSIDEIVETVDECSVIDKEDAYYAAETLKACGYIVSAGPYGNYAAPSVVSAILST